MQDNNNQESSQPSEPKAEASRVNFLHTSKGKKAAILALVVFLMIGAAVFLFVRSLDTNKTGSEVEVSACDPNHENPVYLQAVNALNSPEGNQIDELDISVKEIKQIDNHESYVNCVYPIVIYYALIGNKDKFTNAHNKLEPLLGSNDAISSFAFFDQEYFDNVITGFDRRDNELRQGAVFFQP